MGNVELNYKLPVTLEFRCDLAINWAVGRRRGSDEIDIETGSTADTPPAKTGTIPAETLAVDDLITWGADLFVPAGPARKYTLKVTLSQGELSFTTTKEGTVAGGKPQSEWGDWKCA